jgi:hypothetical protein
MDFGLSRPKGSALPLLADAQSAAVGSRQVGRYKPISNEALQIPRERDKKISPTRNGTALSGAVNLRDENA